FCMPPGRFSTTIGWPSRSRSFSPSARMKTSLMPPGLAVVSARIGRFGQSWADAANVVAIKTKIVAIRRIDKQSTAHAPRNFSRSGNPIAVRGEPEQALHAIITRRARLRDPPLVGAARLGRRKLPDVRVKARRLGEIAGDEFDAAHTANEARRHNQAATACRRLSPSADLALA